MNGIVRWRRTPPSVGSFPVNARPLPHAKKKRIAPPTPRLAMDQARHKNQKEDLPPPRPQNLHFAADPGMLPNRSRMRANAFSEEDSYATLAGLEEKEG